MFSKNYCRLASFTGFCCQKHYDTLGVSPKATAAEIKAAYYKLSLQYHPDRQDGNREQFEKITEAYKVIGEVKSRALYDRGAFDDTFAPRPSRNYHAQTSAAARKSNVPSGQTPIYDFDLWTRSHYGQTIERRKAARARYEEKADARSWYHSELKKTNVTNTLIAVIVTVALSSLFYQSLFDDFDKPRTPRKE